MSNPESHIETINYEDSFFKPFKRKLALLVVFIFIIIASIPIKSFTDKFVYSKLSLNSRCTIGLKSYAFEWFSPKIKLEGVSIPKSCNYKLPANINFKEVNLYIRGLSFSPLGLSFKLSTELLDNKIEAFLIPSFSKLAILLESKSQNGKFLNQENSFNLKTLSSFIPMISLQGNVTLSTVFAELGYDGSLQDLAVNIASDNFKFPTQRIMGFKLQKLQINSLLLQASKISKDKIQIKKLTIGDDKSPLIANFSGNIELNARSIQKSKLKLKGELAVGKELTSQIFIIESFLKRFDKKDKFYQIQIDGTVSKPELSSAR